MFLPFFQPIQEHYQHFLRLGRGSRVRKELEAHTADKIGSHVTNCDELAKLYATYRLDWSSKGLYSENAIVKNAIVINAIVKKRHHKKRHPYLFQNR